MSAEKFKSLHDAVHVLFSHGYLSEVQSQNMHGKIGLDESREMKAALDELKSESKPDKSDDYEI